MEFTKEELEATRDAIFSAMGTSSLWRTAENSILVSKIQSMIDGHGDTEIITADMKRYQAICTLNENLCTYFRVESDVFAFGSYAALDVVHKIICGLVIGGNHFDKEWIDKIIFRLTELKNDNQ